MAATGYSGTPLWKKLGIKPTDKILIIHAPDNYAQLLEIAIKDQMAHKNEVPDLIHLFVENHSQLIIEMKKLKSIIKQNSSVAIWVSWYKKASGIPTDMTEDTIRDYALKNDLVDVKVCAVSEV